jgi:hypothetical protein
MKVSRRPDYGLQHIFVSVDGFREIKYTLLNVLNEFDTAVLFVNTSKQFDRQKKSRVQAAQAMSRSLPQV